MPRTRAQRAQMFQAFDALEGFRKLLQEQEKIIVPKKELSEDECDQLDYLIVQVRVGMIVRLVYYNNGQNLQIEGMVSKINLDTKIIQIVKKKIDIKDIVEIEIIDNKYE